MKTIDCLFIGHNETKFTRYEEMVRSMGTNSGAYRDLNLSFIRHDGKLYTAPEIFNLFNKTYKPSTPFNLGNTFSATIAYLGTYLKRRGFTFDYVNYFQEEKEELAEKLKKNNIRAIAIPTTLYITSFPILEIIAFIREYNDTARIIIGGPFVSTQMKNQDELSLKYMLSSIGADFYINSSQGELALVKILEAMKDGLGYEDIGNVTWLKGDKYITNSSVEENNVLEQNMVDWSLFKDRMGEFAAVRTSISCPFSCAFCGFPQHAGKYQTVSVEALEQELNSLERLGRVKSVNFIDDTFNVPPSRFKEILKMIIRNNYSFDWNCNLRCQFVDREMVELLKESRCEGVFLGIESANQQILNNMNKTATVEKYREGLALLNEYGITSYASIIIGFPGETHDTVQDTIRFIEENRPTFFRTQQWYCEPITPIWKSREKYNISGSSFEWSHSTMDSHTAGNLIYEIFLNVKNSIWVPQYGFEFLGIFNLMHRNMSMDKIKEFLNAFNSAVKEKLKNREQKEISEKTALQLKQIFKEASGTDGKEGPANAEISIIDKYDADFNL